MPDPRWDQLAEILLRHSTRLTAGEILLVECFDLDDDTLARLLVRKATRMGAHVLVDTKQTRMVRELVRNATAPQMRAMGAFELARMQAVQAYIALRGARNANEMADVPTEASNCTTNTCSSRSTSISGSSTPGGACSVCPARAWRSRRA